MNKRYDVTTLSGALDFVNDFYPMTAKRESRMRRARVFERDARQKRDLGFTDEEIWKGAWKCLR